MLKLDLETWTSDSKVLIFRISPLTSTYALFHSSHPPLLVLHFSSFLCLWVFLLVSLFLTMLFTFHVLSLYGLCTVVLCGGCVWYMYLCGVCVCVYTVAEVGWCVNITAGCGTQEGEETGRGWKLKAGMKV